MARQPGDNLLDRPLHQMVWQLALPAMGAMVLRYINLAVDQFWVGRLSTTAAPLAAVAAANFPMWGVFALAGLFGVGMQARIARAVGAGDEAAHAQALKHGLALSAALGVGLAVVGLGLMRPFLAVQGLSDEVLHHATGYLGVLLAGVPITYLGFALGNAYRAEGDTLTPFKVQIVGVAINAALDPWFILGGGPIPKLGVAGSALVTVGVQAVQLVCLAWLRRGRGPSLVGVRYELRQFLQLLRIGYPMAGAGVVFSLVYTVLVKVLAPFGSDAVAAVGLGHTIEGFPHFLCVGFAVAAATLVGQNLGADRPVAAEQAAWQVAWQLTAVLAPIALLYGLLAPWLLGLFMEPDVPEVIVLGTAYLRVAALVQVFGGVDQVFLQAMAGAGETGPPTVVSLVTSLLRIPLAVFLAHGLGLGPRGVWYTVGICTMLRFAGTVVLFRRGDWKLREV